MTLWKLLSSNWNWEPWALLICAALIVTYIVATRFRFTKNALSFMAGGLFLILALLSPISMLGHNYLFSAHMIQHIILLLIVPLLFVIGLPPSLVRNMLISSPLRKVFRVIGHSLVAWVSGIGAMWAWHLPHFYNHALSNESLHMAQQLSLLVMGTIFWWPVFAPLQEWRLTPPIATLYLFSACVGCTILGIIISFTSVGIYPVYLNPTDTLGLLPFLRNELYLTPKVDQQIGGLIMWVPCCLIYLSASMITLARWYRAPEGDNIPPPPVNSGQEVVVNPTVTK